jgi:hypothetical protein
MIKPTIAELTKEEMNRYELVIAIAKSARRVTDEYVEQRARAERMVANRETEKSLASLIESEYRDQKAVKIAIDAGKISTSLLQRMLSVGYGKAFTAIIDSNITTIMTGIILFVVGTGPVRGFAIMLTGGVVISMFTAVVVTRLIFDYTVDPNRTKPFKMLQFFKNPKIDFMAWGKKAIILSNIKEDVKIISNLPKGFEIYLIDKENFITKTKMNPKKFKLKENTVVLIKNY